MPKLYLFRHGETSDNKEHLFSGTRDVDLTESGIQNACQIRDKLQKSNIQIAFSSPMIRTRKTIEIVLEYHPEVKVCLDNRLIERSYGILQGQSKDKIAKESLQLFKFFHRSYYVAPPQGESLYSVDMRVRPFIMDLVKSMNKLNFNAAVCAHGNSIRALRIFFENRPQSDFNKIETAVGQLFEYETDAADIVRLQEIMNSTALR